MSPESPDAGTTGTAEPLPPATGNSLEERVAERTAELTELNRRLLAENEERRRITEALRASEERFRDVAEASSDSIWETGPDLRYTFVVNGGRDGDQAHRIGRTREQTADPADLRAEPAKWAQHRAVLDSRQPFRDFQYPVVDALGERRHLSVSGKPIFEAQGRFLGYRGTSTDITTLKRHEAEARGKAALLEATFHNIDQGIAVWDRDRRLMACNRRFLELLRLPESYGTPGMPFETVVRYNAEIGTYGPGEVAEIIHARTAATFGPQSSCREITLSDGTVIEVRCNPMPEGDAVVAYTDITERKVMEQALRQSEERYALALNGTNDGLWDWDIGSDLIYVSGRFQLLGFDDGTTLHTSPDWLVHIHPDDLETYKRALRAHLKGESEFLSLDYRVMRPDGGMHWVRQRGLALRDAEGRAYRMAGSVGDITTMKRNEQALAELNRTLEQQVLERTRDLAAKALELEEANRRLRELDRLKSDFLSSVSHELRTPLTSILGFARLIARDVAKVFLPLVPEGKPARTGQRILDNLDIIRKESERLTRLINDVLDLAKIESGRMDWRDAPLAPHDLVARAVLAVQGQFADKPAVRLIVAADDDLPAITADRDRLIQVLINLLNNAAKFTERGHVRVLAQALPDRGLRFGIEDTGPGIPAHELDQVFDKFHQVVHQDTLVDKPRGTGLGLAICDEIVRHYGGRMWAESELGRGSTFYFTLPVTGNKGAGDTGAGDKGGMGP